MQAVWITRALPAADETAQRVGALGYEPVVEPLLETAPEGEGPVEFVGVGALAFTSAAAVRALAARTVRRDLPAFTVGDATAAAARAAGFARVISAGGDVAALSARILAAPPVPGAVLHAGAADLAGDLTGALRAGGREARRLILYRTIPREPSPALLARLPGLRAVLVHSARGARRLAQILARAQARQLLALCLSEAVAEPLRGADLAALAAAAAPTEAALLELLRARTA